MSKAKLRMLVVDDDHGHARAVERALKMIGRYQVTLAHTPEEALHTLAHDGPFDVAAIDLLFGHGSEPRGFEIISNARAMRVSVVAITGSTDASHRNHLERMNVRCLTKPWDPESLAYLFAVAHTDMRELDDALRLAVDELAAMHALGAMEKRLASIIARGIGPGGFARELGPHVTEREKNDIRTNLFDKCGWAGVARPNANLLRERLLERAFAIRLRKTFEQGTPP